MNRQLESMTRVKVGTFIVRVWRTEEDLSKVDNSDIEELAHKLWIQMRHLPQMVHLAEAFEILPRIAAIEVLDAMGNGVLIYPDWK